MDRYTPLRETALCNFDKLLSYWDIVYQKITDDEYDFINPLRHDTNFGACRFNVKKGIGSDFAGSIFTAEDFAKFGAGFTKEDFSSLNESTEVTNWGFDVIGLCGRLHKISDYKESAKRLAIDLKDIENNIGITKITPEYIKNKEKQREQLNLSKLKFAKKTWSICQNVEGTPGETYLRNRGISQFGEGVTKFHGQVFNKESNTLLPTLLFKITEDPNGDIQAVHRIYLSERGDKAALKIQKMALGAIKGNGIWFNKEIKDKLYIVEGPENALSILSMGRTPVVSTINASNFPNLTIPDSVKVILLCPDNDKAGIYYSKKALKAYSKKGRIIKIILPPPGKDFNDLLVEGSYSAKQ